MHTSTTTVGYTERYNTYTNKPYKRVIIAGNATFLSDPVSVISVNQDPPSTVKIYEELEYNIKPQTDDDTHSQAEITNTEDYISSRENTQPTPIERRITRSQTKQLHESNTKQQNTERALFTLDEEPRTLKDAQNSHDWPNWKAAMEEQIKALERNNTWTLVDQPPKSKPIKNKWVFKIKLKPDGTIDRYNARLVAKGFTQIENVDYKETYAPVASMTTIRMLFAYANQHDMAIVQFDIKTAFLYGDLEETIFVEFPESLRNPDNKTCHLQKFLYGLKQAPRNWNKKFDNFLERFNLSQADTDRCLYYNQDRSLVLAIYVDDGLAASQD